MKNEELKMQECLRLQSGLQLGCFDLILNS